MHAGALIRPLKSFLTTLSEPHGYESTNEQYDVHQEEIVVVPRHSHRNGHCTHLSHRAGSSDERRAFGALVQCDNVDGFIDTCLRCIQSFLSAPDQQTADDLPTGAMYVAPLHPRHGKLTMRQHSSKALTALRS